jgi:hypothetical protein
MISISTIPSIPVCRQAGMLGISNWVNKMALLFYVSKLDSFLVTLILHFCSTIQDFKSKSFAKCQAGECHQIIIFETKKVTIFPFSKFQFSNKSLKINGFKHPILFGIEIAI